MGDLFKIKELRIVCPICQSSEFYLVLEPKTKLIEGVRCIECEHYYYLEIERMRKGDYHDKISDSSVPVFQHPGVNPTSTIPSTISPGKSKIQPLKKQEKLRDDCDSNEDLPKTE